MLRRLFVVLCAVFMFFSCTTCPPSESDWQDFENHLVSSFNYYILKGKVSGTYFADDVTKYGEEMVIYMYGEYYDYGDSATESEYVDYITFVNQSEQVYAPGVYINARYVDVTGVPFDMSFDTSSVGVEIVTTYIIEDHEWKKVSYTSGDFSIKGRIKRAGDDFWNPEIGGEVEISCKDYFNLKITDIECMRVMYPIYE